MPSPLNITNITPPRVPLVDERTGLISREWYRFFLNLFNLTGGGTNATSLTDLQIGPPFAQIDEFNAAIDAKTADLTPTQESALDEIAELSKQVEALAVLPLTSWVLSELAELQTQIDGLLVATIPPVNFLTNGASILYGDNLGGFSNVTIGSGVSFSGGTLSATGSGGTVTSVTGAAPITSTGGNTPVIGVTSAALTEVDDTNVTLTLGGSPSTALLAATSLTLGWTGQLAATRGGTGFGSYAVGDILYANTTTTLAKLADVATGNALISGGVGVAPAWGKIGLTTHVSGTLPVTNGGTGTATTFIAGSVVFAGASGVYSQDNANFFWDDTNNRLGLGITTPTCTLDVVGGIKTSRASVTSPAATDGNVFSGTYSATQVSTNTNVDTVTFGSCQYMRVGNVITVSGQIGIDATTAALDTIVRMAIPVASTFSSARQLAGAGVAFTSPYAANSLAILADTTNFCAELRARPSVNTNLNYNFSFTYQVI